MRHWATKYRIPVSGGGYNGGKPDRDLSQRPIRGSVPSNQSPLYSREGAKGTFLFCVDAAGQCARDAHLSSRRLQAILRAIKSLAGGINTLNSRANLPSLFIVDDDPLIRDTLRLVLADEFDIHLAEDRAHAIRLLRNMSLPPQLALVDLGLPPTPHRPEEGFRLIAELLAHSPLVKVIALSGQDDRANARHARALGAIEFVAKPCSPETIKAQLHSALRIQLDERPPGTTPNKNAPGSIGNSPPMQAMRRQIELYATSPFPVLIEGESGSGKELVAATLQNLSSNRSAPYIVCSCAAISPHLLESAFFGHIKGAFTGATASQAGFFEEAGAGTLFLDEIGELPLELQAKLLRVLENGEFQRVGETTTRKSHARIITATNRDLKACVRDGKFRIDLYHRLSIFTVQVPPLRTLGADKFLLLDHFREHYATRAHRPPFRLAAGAEKLWDSYTFPGNTRELRNIVIRLCTKYPGLNVNAPQLEAELDLAHSNADASATGPMTDVRFAMERGTFNLDEHLMDYTNRHIDIAMDMTRGNISEAAKLLGIARTTLYSRMEALQKHKAQKKQ
ncbi:MAG: sigma-54-dependent Fis family transcriptional regulator [Gallionellaceae bacterium]|nr:MAG: sigma-54-dependent Fis family transcriptional regulator [Gallionellaceae bacterium]